MLPYLPASFSLDVLYQELNILGNVPPLTLKEDDIVTLFKKGFNRVFMPGKRATAAKALVEQLKSSSSQQYQGLEMDIIGVDKVEEICPLEMALL